MMGSFTKATGSPTGSIDAGDRPGSQTRPAIAATTPPGVANGSSRSPGFVGDSTGHRTSSRLRNIRAALNVGRLRRAVRVRDRAHLDRRARKYTGWPAAEADGLFRGGLGIFGCCICHPPNLLDKSCERTSPACPAMDKRKTPCLAVDHGLRLRHRQHASRGNPSPVVQSGVSKLARDPANGSGCAVWSGRGSRDQCRLAHCMPGFDPVACAGSARSGDHRHDDFRSRHRAFFRKSQKTFLSASASLNLDAETLTTEFVHAGIDRQQQKSRSTRIGMAAQRGERPIDLFGEHDARELVRKSHRREREQQVGARLPLGG